MKNAEHLAQLLRSAFTYEQVINAKAKYPDAIAETAKLLKPAEVTRLKKLRELHDQTTSKAIDPDYLLEMRRLLRDRLISASREDFSRDAQNYMFDKDTRMAFIEGIQETHECGSTFHRRCELRHWFDEEYQLFMKNYQKHHG